ncbi:hypothetical protein SAMN04487910_3344 [Aquimarina amphilecti]|uniref:Uncharacterized protein n=1 Tax=Aquimarina amphilecti TaxID=1038014 RepID=A0A1H7TBD5_AQUAM|nr:hypothetical protein [Aquimarina amphilecti]SEL81626.1 hypothetical protein SAMN04487910_3344 [Aquimarina amphilecti]
MKFPWFWIAVLIGAIFVYLNTKKAQKDISNYKKDNQQKTDEDIHKDGR